VAYYWVLAFEFPVGIFQLEFVYGCVGFIDAWGWMIGWHSPMDCFARITYVYIWAYGSPVHYFTCFAGSVSHFIPRWLVGFALPAILNYSSGWVGMQGEYRWGFGIFSWGWVGSWELGFVGVGISWELGVGSWGWEWEGKIEG
jgi:hypothetical protein